MKRFFPMLTLGLAGAVMAASSAPLAPAPVATCAASTGAATTGAPPSVAARSGIDTATIDPAVRPQDDFFTHLNGKWMAATDFPADKASWGSLPSRATQQIVSIKTDPHAPGRFRANGALTNQAKFYDAFGVKEGDKMYRAPTERVHIW